MYKRILEHNALLSDQVRIKAYNKAISEVVKSGDIVADIGTGSGILAFLAVRAGAKKVYAIEKESVIEEARQLTRINHMEGRITFVQGRSDRIDLPEKVDVVTSELIGFLGIEEYLPFYQIDARKRFLKPGGVLVPSWLELHLVPMESETIWQEKIGVWQKDFYGFDFSALREHAVSRTYIVEHSSDTSLLSTPEIISRIDFDSMEDMPLLYQTQFSVQKTGRFHGYVGYFRVGLSPSVILSTAPDKPQTHWRQTYFPAQDMMMVEDGDKIHCRMKAIPFMGNVFWEWKTKIYRQEKMIIEFSQSDFDVSKKTLDMGTPDFVPVLNDSGNIHRRVLNLCDGEKTKEEIVQHLLSEYPKRYSSVNEASREVVKIMEKFA
jgi:ubiquinone/menaquinone biosynthesis C-methylase UbiE